jgi:arabinofuranosyltransferase
MSRPKAPRGAAPAAAQAPSPLAWLDLRGPYLVPALLLLVTRAWFATRIPFAAEDAYITFRYARNFAHGLGPVFNAGEKVFGFTSAPWMAWTALGLAFGQDPVLWTRVTLVIADLVTLFAMASLLERHASRASAWCFGMFLAAWPYFAALAGTGLEMGAMLALLSGAAWLVDRRHPAAGVAIGLLGAFRPEGLLAAAALAVWAGKRDRLVALGVLAAILGALALYFGSPLPQSMMAKAAVYGTPGPLGSKHWWDWAIPFPVGNGLASTSEGKNLFLISVLLTPAALAGVVGAWKARRTALAAAAAAATVVWLGYIGSGAVYFFWYFATPLFAWVLLAAIGLPRLVNGPFAYAAALLAIAGHWTYEPYLYTGRAFWEGNAFGTLGQYVAQKARPGETVMLEPIGTIGWRAADQRVLDEVGLVSPEVSRRRRQGPGWYADIVAGQRPEWLVVRAGLLRRGEAFTGAGAPFRSLEERLATLAAYDTSAVGDTTAGDDNFVILRRADRK